MDPAFICVAAVGEQFDGDPPRAGRHTDAAACAVVADHGAHGVRAVPIAVPRVEIRFAGGDMPVAVVNGRRMPAVAAVFRHERRVLPIHPGVHVGDHHARPVEAERRRGQIGADHGQIPRYAGGRLRPGRVGENSLLQEDRLVEPHLNDIIAAGEGGDQRGLSFEGDDRAGPEGAHVARLASLDRCRQRLAQGRRSLLGIRLQCDDDLAAARQAIRSGLRRRLGCRDIAGLPLDDDALIGVGLRLGQGAIERRVQAPFRIG